MDTSLPRLPNFQRIVKRMWPPLSNSDLLSKTLVENKRSMNVLSDTIMDANNTFYEYISSDHACVKLSKRSLVSNL